MREIGDGRNDGEMDDGGHSDDGSMVEMEDGDSETEEG